MQRIRNRGTPFIALMAIVALAVFAGASQASLLDIDVQDQVITQTLNTPSTQPVLSAAHTASDLTSKAAVVRTLNIEANADSGALLARHTTTTTVIDQTAAVGSDSFAIAHTFVKENQAISGPGIVSFNRTETGLLKIPGADNTLLANYPNPFNSANKALAMLNAEATIEPAATTSRASPSPVSTDSTDSADSGDLAYDMPGESTGAMMRIAA